MLLQAIDVKTLRYEPVEDDRSVGQFDRMRVAGIPAAILRAPHSQHARTQMREFKGKTAVVTGAASGMGRAFAERFAQEGMRVVLADVEAPALEAAVRELRQREHEVIGVRAGGRGLAAGAGGGGGGRRR